MLEPECEERTLGLDIRHKYVLVNEILHKKNFVHRILHD